MCQLYKLKDEYHAIDTEVTDVDMERSPIGTDCRMLRVIH